MDSKHEYKELLMNTVAKSLSKSLDEFIYYIPNYKQQGFTISCGSFHYSIDEELILTASPEYIKRLVEEKYLWHVKYHR